MPARIALVCAAFACGLAPVHGAAAQSYLPVSLETSVGVAVGSGGDYVHRNAAAVEVLAARRLRQTPAGMLVAGVTLGAQTSLVGDDACLLLPGGGCAPPFPAFVSGGVFLGVQRGSARTGSARFMAGPVYYRADGGGALGVRGLVDVATAPWGRTALVASLRHAVLPSFRREVVGITSIGIGLRIQ